MLKLDNLRPWEEVLMVLKRHWIAYVIVGLYFIFWIMLTIIIFYFFGLNTYINIILCVFWMMWSLFLYVEWLNHELDMFVITNKKIIWIEQITFLNRVVTECNLGQVQEVNSKTKWLFSNLFNFGTVYIQTAWNATNLKMELVEDSINKSRDILNIVSKYWWEKTDSISTPPTPVITKT